MSLTLITGSANSGKSGYIHRPLIEAIEAGHPGALLLPSHADVMRARLEFSERVAVGATIDTLDGWAAQLWGLYGDGRRPADAMVRQLAIQSVVAGRAAGVLDRSAKYDGFARLLGDLVARVAGLSVPAARNPIDEQLVALATEYYARLAGWGYIEPAEMLVELSRTAAVWSGYVGVNRFSDLSAQQEAFLTSLAAAADVRIAFTWTADAPTTAALDPSVRRLSRVGEHVVLDEDRSEDELSKLGRQLFTGAPLEPGGAVRFVECSGPEAEIAAVATAVESLMRAGVEPERVAIVFRSADRRWRALEAALAASDIASQIDVSQSFGATPFGATLLGLVEAAALGRARREEVVALLRGPFSDLSSDDVDDLDRSWRRRRAVESAAMLRQVAARDGAFASAVRRALRIGEAGTAEDWVELAAELMRAGRVRGRSETETRFDAAAQRATESMAQALSLQGEPTSVSAVMAALQNVNVATGSSERRGAVVITEAHRIRGRRFDAVILGGLSAAEFPSAPREPLAVSVLRRLGMPAGTDERLSERMLYYSILTRPRQQLVLVRQATDAKGEPSRASVFWEETLELYRRGDRYIASVESWTIDSPERVTPQFTSGRRELRARSRTGAVSPPVVLRGRLSDPSLLDVGEREFSVTEVETYLSCPYRWFYDRVIRPKSLDRTFDSREKGSVAHRLLAETYRALKLRGIGRVDAAVLPEALAELRDQASRLAESGEVALLGVAEELSWDQAVRWARSVLEADVDLLTDWRPVEHEWRFGEAAGRPFELAGVRLQGAVDRIDEGPGGVVITDYKSSQGVDPHTKFEADIKLQPIVYSSAVQSLIGSRVVGGLYRSLSSGALAGFWNVDRAELPETALRKSAMDEGEFDRLTEWASEAVSKAVDGMRAGRIGPDPTEGACTHCGIRTLCEARR